MKLIRVVFNAGYGEAAETVLAQLLAHPYGKALGRQLTQLMDRLLIFQLDYCQGLQQVSPEWYWRDYRLRRSRVRNHRSELRLERAVLLWAVYQNFEPAQWRSECTRQYRHPGQSAFEVAGVPLGQVTYLNALGV